MPAGRRGRESGRRPGGFAGGLFHPEGRFPPNDNCDKSLPQPASPVSPGGLHSDNGKTPPSPGHISFAPGGPARFPEAVPEGLPLEVGFGVTIATGSFRLGCRSGGLFDRSLGFPGLYLPGSRAMGTEFLEVWVDSGILGFFDFILQIEPKLKKITFRGGYGIRDLLLQVQNQAYRLFVKLGTAQSLNRTGFNFRKMI